MTHINLENGYGCFWVPRTSFFKENGLTFIGRYSSIYIPHTFLQRFAVTTGNCLDSSDFGDPIPYRYSSLFIIWKNNLIFQVFLPTSLCGVLVFDSVSRRLRLLLLLLLHITSLSHTTLSHTIFHTQLCHTQL